MKINSKISIFSALIMLMVSYCAKAQKKEIALKLDPEVHYGKLANGFTYFIRHNEEPKHRVDMYLVNNVGSILEDEDQQGLAHFMEHMSFNGTEHFPHNQLVDYLQKSGLRFGADINAHTTFDETVYQLPLPSDKPEILNQGLLIMHDWAQSATLDPGEIDRERGVVLEEERLGKGASERMERQIWPVLLNNSRYAVRIPIGLDTVLHNFKRPIIARFYKDWYRPDLQALIIVGDINADSMENVIKTKFSDLTNPVKERLRREYTVSLDGKNHFIAVTDIEMTATVAEIIIKHPQPALKTEGDYRKAIVRDLFNEMLGKRFAELSREENPAFIQGSASITGFIGGLDNFDAKIVSRPGELEKGFKAVWRETERVLRFGFTESELERAKTGYLINMEEALKEKDKTSSGRFAQEYQQYFLHNEAAPGISKESQLATMAMPSITLKEVNQLAEIYIRANNRDIVIEAPEKEKSTLPDETEVAKWMTSVKNENLLPYKDEVSLQPLLMAKPVPGKIISETRNEKMNIVTLILSNGVKVIIKPTNFRNDEILFTGFAPGGTSVYNNADCQSAINAASIISGAGAGNYDANQIDKYLQNRQFGVRPFIGDLYQGFTGGSSQKDLKAALEMVYAEFMEPRKDSKIFAGFMKKALAGLENRDNDPKAVFNDTVSAVLSSYNPRKTAPSIEKLNQINLDRAYEIYKDRFADASGFTFTFVGNIDTPSIKPLLEEYLGSLPSTNSHEQARNLGIHIPEGKIKKAVYKGSEPKATVVLVYSGVFDDNPENRIMLDALQETLEIRLVQRLREDESGVYSPGIYASSTKFPEKRYSIIIQFSCAPQNVDKLIASTKDEINKMKNSGPQLVDLEKWRASDKSSRENKLKDNGFWLSSLTDQLQNQESFDEINAYDVLRDKITSSDIQEMSTKCLSGGNFIQLLSLPEQGTHGTN